MALSRQTKKICPSNITQPARVVRPPNCTSGVVTATLDGSDGGATALNGLVGVVDHHMVEARQIILWG